MYKLRFIAPVPSEEVINAPGTDLSDAACDLLLANRSKALFVKPEDAGRSDGDTTYFAKMEVIDGDPDELVGYRVDDGVFVARCFYGGIGRKGGVKPPRNPLQCASLSEVEARLGLEVGYLDCDWAGEESEKDAMARQRVL